MNNEGCPSAKSRPAGPRAARRVPPSLRVIAWTAAGLALAAVFTAYLSPHLAFDLASRAWACF